MTEAIFGLAGVIVGGLVTAGYEEWKIRRAEAMRRRAAARVLADELAWFRSGLTASLNSGNVGTLPYDVGALLKAWQDRRDALTSLSFEQWETVHLAVRAADLAPAFVAGEPLTGDGRKSLEKRRDKAVEAIDLLRRIGR